VGAGKKASDEVEGLKFEVKWEISKGAFGVKVAEEDVRVEEGELAVVSCLLWVHFPSRGCEVLIVCLFAWLVGCGLGP